MASLDSKIPKGPLSDKWTNHKSHINLVSPANKRLIDIIVVGTGLAGASASATLAIILSISSGILISLISLLQSCRQFYQSTLHEETCLQFY